MTQDVKDLRKTTVEKEKKKPRKKMSDIHIRNSLDSVF